MQTFLKQLDNNCDIWFKMTLTNQIVEQFKRFFNSKSYQDATKRNFNQYFNQSDRYFYLSFKQNSIHMNNSQNRTSNKRFLNFDIIIKIEKKANASLIEMQETRIIIKIKNESNITEMAEIIN